VRLGAGEPSPLLIGREFGSSSGTIVLRRSEREVRRVESELDESGLGDGFAAALSTVSSEREEDDGLRLDELRPEDERDPEELEPGELDELEPDEPDPPELDPEGAFEGRRPERLGSSPFGCSLRTCLEPDCFELDPDCFDELREERFGGATRAVSQYGQSFQSRPTGLEQVGHSSFSLVRQDGQRMKPGSVGKPHLWQECSSMCRRRTSAARISVSRSATSSRNSGGRRTE